MNYVKYAKELISEYCEQEFHTKASFDNLERIPVGFTELREENGNVHVFQANVDLMNPRIWFELDGDTVIDHSYLLLSALINDYLKEMTFDSLTYEVREKFNLDEF